MQTSTKIDDHKKISSLAKGMLHFVKIKTAIELYQAQKISLEEACDFSAIEENDFLEYCQNPQKLSNDSKSLDTAGII